MSFQTSNSKPLFARSGSLGRSRVFDDGSNTVSSRCRSFQVIHLMNIVAFIVVGQVRMGSVREPSAERSHDFFYLQVVGVSFSRMPSNVVRVSSS